MAKIWRAIVALNFWTAGMIIFAKILQGHIYEGSVIVWLCGIPFIYYMLWHLSDQRIDLLLINVNKFQNGQEVQHQIRYILHLIAWQSLNGNAAILLDGYIEIHKQTWKKDDDPLKQKGVKNNRFTKSLMSQDETLTEKYALLIQMLYKMYFFGIKKFPKDNSLRIAYSFFLLEKMHTKQQALQELNQAEQNNPSFDHQFIIFRYKKIIEDDIAESQNEGQGGLDVVSEVAFQTVFKQFQANIEKSSLLHMEFWSQLSEDNPDLAKLSDIGSKINTQTQYVDDNWSKLMKINPNNHKSMRLYGKYLIEIINDKDEGDELLEKAMNIANVQNNKKFTNLLSNGNDENLNEATPFISISGEQDNFGVITHINLMAASLFGYNKTELLNRKVNVLMPHVFSKFHDQFLENYLNSGESAIIGKNKLRLVFGKTKSNYILPMYLNIKAVQSIISGIQFVAAFRVEKNFKNAAYILTTPDGTIDAISSSSINLLKLDQKVITQRKANIQDFIPDIVNNRNTLFSSLGNNGKASALIKYQYPLENEYMIDGEEDDIQLSCQLSELVFLAGKENGGLQFRFEKLSEKAVGHQQLEKKAKITNFQFKFERNKARILGEYVEGAIMDLNNTTINEKEEVLGGLDKSEIISSDQNNDDLDTSNIQLETLKKKMAQAEEEVVVQRKDYGVGIKTLKLMNGRPMEIDIDSSDEEDEYEEVNGRNNNNPQRTQQLAQDDNLDEAYRDFDTTFKSRKTLNAVINDKTPPVTIRNLKYTINILCVVLYVIAIIDYSLSITTFNDIQKNISSTSQSNQCLGELMKVLTNTQNLYLLNMGLFTGYFTETQLRGELKNALDNAKGLMQVLQQNSISLSSEHANLLGSPVIALVSMDGTTSYAGLFQATQEIISRGYVIYAKPLANILETDSDYYYVTYNLLNSFYIGFRQSSQYYTSELVNRVSDKDGAFLPYLLTSVGALILTIVILLPILYQVGKQREEVLSLFLDIPEKTVKSLYNKCEGFISSLQVGEEDDIVSEIDENELDRNKAEEDSQEFIPRKKKKKFKNSSRSHTSFFLRFFVLMVIVEAYFVYDFIDSRNLLNDINTMMVEYNSTSLSASFYSFAKSAERQLFIDPSVKILNADSKTVTVSNIQSLYDLDSLVLEQHSINRNIHSDAYNSLFNQIMMLNPCYKISEFVSYDKCTSFAQGSVAQGMAVALTGYFENLRSLLNCYTKIQATSSCSLVNSSVSITGKTTAENERLSLLISNPGLDTYNMQNSYINHTFAIMVSGFEDSLNNDFDSAETRKLIIFIVFLVVIGVIYVVAWIPVMRKTSNDIWKTKSMLSMIPLNVIAKIRSIRMYLKRFWNDRNLVEQ